MQIFSSVFHWSLLFTAHVIKMWYNHAWSCDYSVEVWQCLDISRYIQLDSEKRSILELWDFRTGRKCVFFIIKFHFWFKKAIFRLKSLENSVLCPPIKRFSVQELLDLLWIYVTVKRREKWTRCQQVLTALYCYKVLLLLNYGDYNLINLPNIYFSQNFANFHTLL